jgi:diguanylate cyclase (GGDEF)-like protein
MKIRTKLLLALASISLVPPIAAYVALIANPRISFALRMNEFEAQQGTLADHMQSDVRGIRAAFEESLSETYRIQVVPKETIEADQQRKTANEAVRDGVLAFEKDLAEISRSMSDQMQVMASSNEPMNTSEQRETQIVNQISKLFPRLKSNTGDFIALSDRFAIREEGELVQKVLEPSVQENLDQILQLANETDVEAAEDRHNIESALHFSYKQSFLVVLAGLALSVFLARLLSRVVITPIHDLRAAAKAIGQGKMQTRLAIHSKDELGDLASCFNFMANDLTQLIEQNTQAQKDLSSANTRLQSSMDELESSNRHAGVLSESAELLQSCFTADEASDVIASTAVRLFPALSGALLVFSASRNVLEAMAVWGPDPPSERVFGQSDCWALRRGRVHHSLGTGGTCCKHLTGPSGSASMCAPLAAHGETLGILCLTSNSHPADGPLPVISESDMRLAISLAEQAALSFANLKLRDKLRYQSVRDPLTGLFNRRYLDETLEREVPNALRKSRNLGLIMIDVDHFKKFNDIHGHDAGDAVLREFGDFLTKSVRRGDVACRYGGEEFVLVLVESNLEDTLRRAEELRVTFQHLTIKYRDLVLGKVTISAGVAALPDHGVTASDLLTAADAALLRAKEQGRDRVVMGKVPSAQPA